MYFCRDVWEFCPVKRVELMENRFVITVYPLGARRHCHVISHCVDILGMNGSYLYRRQAVVPFNPEM